MELKFYKVKNTILATDKDEDLGLEEIKPNTVDASFEKHVPHVERAGRKVMVRIGEVAHPMSEEHFIEMIVLHTDQGYKIKHLHPGDAPKATFAILDNEIVFSAYAYCNLHGLWKKASE